jgi:hypothetical protein
MALSNRKVCNRSARAARSYEPFTTAHTHTRTHGRTGGLTGTSVPVTEILDRIFTNRVFEKKLLTQSSSIL